MLSGFHDVRKNSPESKRRVLHFLSPEKMVGSQKWGYIIIITGTILGGTLGFYVMHRVEISYKEKMNERLKEFESKMKKTEKLE